MYCQLQRWYRCSLWIDKLFHPKLYNVCNSLFMLGRKLIIVITRGPCYCAMGVAFADVWNVTNVHDEWYSTYMSILTHWGRVTHICVGNLTIIGSDNGFSPGRHQAITWTNVGILIIGPRGTKLQWNANRNSYIFIQENPFENVVWKMAVILARTQCVNSFLLDTKLKL